MGKEYHTSLVFKKETTSSNSNVKNKIVNLSPYEKKSAVSSGITGLPDIDNSSFYNSVLQCLSQTPRLEEILKQMEVSKEVYVILKNGNTLSGNLEKCGGTCETLADTLIAMRNGKPMLPASILLKLLREKPEFRGNGPQDAHRLLCHLLDSIRKGDLRRYRRIILAKLDLKPGVDRTAVDNKTITELKQMDAEVTKQVVLIPDQIFRGFTVNRVECQVCSNISEYHNPFSNLTLPLASEKPRPPTAFRKRCVGSVEKTVNTQFTRKAKKTCNGRYMGQGVRNSSSSEPEENDSHREYSESDESKLDGKKCTIQCPDNKLGAGVSLSSAQKRSRERSPVRAHHFEPITQQENIISNEFIPYICNSLEINIESIMDSQADDSSSSGSCEAEEEYSVQSCLLELTRVKLMVGKNKVSCEMCTAKANNGCKYLGGINTVSTKQLLIAEAPPVLLLHINRFQVQPNNTIKKLTHHMEFALELDISKFCKIDMVNNISKKPVYSLYGVVEHRGNFDSGHYIAFVKGKNGRWYFTSDENVIEIKDCRVLDAQAYLLFYKLQL